MRKRFKILGIAVVLAILAGLAVGAVALAQDSTSTTTTAPDWVQKYKEALASALGITVDQYDAAVKKAQDQVVSDAVTEGWLTQNQAEMLRWRLSQEPQAGLEGGKGFGMMGLGRGDMGMGGMGDNLISIVADKLGMTISDVMTALQGGKTIADLAKEKNVDTQVIVDAYLATYKQNLDTAVTNGNITQKQADLMLEQATTRVTNQLTNTWQGGMGFGHGGRGHGGGMMGFPGMGGW